MSFITAGIVRGTKRQQFSTLQAALKPSIKSSLYPCTSYSLDLKKKQAPAHHAATDSHDDHGSHDETHMAHKPTPYRPISALTRFTTRNFGLRTSLTPARSVLSNTITRRYSTSNEAKRKVAVVLSGCGVYDGSEIHEAVSLLVHLSRAGYTGKCFAPDVDQSEVINHVKGSAVEDASRNVLQESARIARGKIKALSELRADNYEALFFPGGYGAAKNLSTFAKEGENFVVIKDVERVIKEFQTQKKPIGLCCVAPILAAKVIPGVEVTVGDEDKDVQATITKVGGQSVPVGVEDIVVDKKNMVVTTPAYMVNAPVHKVFDGIGKLVESVLSMTHKVDRTETTKQDPPTK